MSVLEDHSSPQSPPNLRLNREPTCRGSGGEFGLAALTHLLELWDGVCCLYAERSKPDGPLGHVLALLKLFPAATRDAAAAKAQARPLDIGHIDIGFPPMSLTSGFRGFGAFRGRLRELPSNEASTPLC